MIKFKNKVRGIVKKHLTINKVPYYSKNGCAGHSNRGVFPGFAALFLIGFILVVFCSLATFVQAEIKGAPAPAQPDRTGIPAVNAITQTATQAGVLSCATRINQVTDMLTARSRSGAFLFLPRSQPDQRIFSASLEVLGEGVPAVYASESFAPNQANGCGVMYEAVAYWNASCDDVATRQFPGNKRVGVLYRNIAILDGEDSVRIFLMPAGTGCVSIKKEVLQ